MEIVEFGIILKIKRIDVFQKLIDFRLSPINQIFFGIRRERAATRFPGFYGDIEAPVAFAECESA